PLHGRAAEGRPGGHHAGGLRRLRLALAGRAGALERGRRLRSRARRGGGRQLALIVAALLGLLAAPAPACERARGAADAPVALILSGGGAKGAWEAGVAAALVERGLPVRLAGGSSAGALNAAMVADGRLTGRPPVLEALALGRPIGRAVVVMSYAPDERASAPTTLRRTLEEAMELVMIHAIRRDVELARLRHPDVDVQLLTPSAPLM